MSRGTEVCWLSCRVNRRYEDHINVCHEVSAVRCCSALNISASGKENFCRRYFSWDSGPVIDICCFSAERDS